MQKEEERGLCCRKYRAKTAVVRHGQKSNAVGMVPAQDKNNKQCKPSLKITILGTGHHGVKLKQRFWSRLSSVQVCKDEST